MEQQRSEEWFKKRIGKVTGSRVGAILGLNPWMSRKDVMRAMVRDYHGYDTSFSNIATEYGTSFEQMAIDDFEIETGIDVIETGFHIKEGADWLGASPDGLTDDGAVVEIKCPYSKKDGGEFVSVTEQLHYYAQTQIEMFCTNREKCYFYQWSPHGSKLETIDYNDSWMRQHLPELELFYNDYLVELKNPDKHLSPLTQTKESTKLAAKYEALKAEESRVKAELANIKDQLIQLADGKKTNVSGVLVYEVERKGSVDYKKVPELKGVDLEPYRKESTKYWAVK